MKNLTFIAFVILLASCGNKKAEIVELIKKTKNEWYQAEMNRGAFNSVAIKLRTYNNSLNDIKRYRDNELMRGMVKINKDAYDGAVQQLKITVPNVSNSLFKDQNKLDSLAHLYEMQTWDLKHKLDSLELELKKY